MLVLAFSSPWFRERKVWGPLLTLGTASYAIYLVHNPFLSIAVRVVKSVFPSISPWPGLMVISVAALGAGLFYWWLYERHMLLAVKSWLKR